MQSRAKNKFLLGIFLIVFTYISYLFPREYFDLFSLSLLLFLFILGVVEVSEGITLDFRNKSLVHDILSSKKNLLAIIIVSATDAIITESNEIWRGRTP
jgi:hypothetical protein